MSRLPCGTQRRTAAATGRKSEGSNQTCVAPHHLVHRAHQARSTPRRSCAGARRHSNLVLAVPPPYCCSMAWGRPLSHAVVDKPGCTRARVQPSLQPLLTSCACPKVTPHKLPAAPPPHSQLQSAGTAVALWPCCCCLPPVASPGDQPTSVVGDLCQLQRCRWQALLGRHSLSSPQRCCCCCCTRFMRRRCRRAWRAPPASS